MSVQNKTNEPAHYKTYNKTCATSEDSDQPAHLCNLIRVFTDLMCLLHPPGYSKRDKRESLPYWVDIQADWVLCWSHRSYCRFCHVLAQICLSGYPSYLKLVWLSCACIAGLVISNNVSSSLHEMQMQIVSAHSPYLQSA